MELNGDDLMIDQTDTERSVRSAEPLASISSERARQHLAAEPPGTHFHQMIRVAVAITIPVTKAAKQENSRRSCRTTVMASSPDASHRLSPAAIADSLTVAKE